MPDKMPANIAAPTSLLRADAFLSPLEIEAAVKRALEEDLGRAGDITSIATIPENLSSSRVRLA
jgi:nicotinate-nucleotide pyrophosphorylase (carboxylating)